MKMKQLYSLLAALLLALLPITATAYDFMVDDLAYDINEDGISVSVTYTVNTTSNYSGLTIANIPFSVTYEGKTYTVTSIGYRAFQSCTALTSVTIPNSVTSIVSNAFTGCSCLTSVTIPSSVTSVGNYVFGGCSGLQSVEWNASTCNDFGTTSSVAPTHPFKDVTNITSFTFGNEVKRIPAYLCYSLTGLTSVTIPDSVTSIGSHAFQYCSGLSSLSIGNSVTSFGSNAFSGCTSLQNVVWNAKKCTDFSYSNSSSSSTSPFSKSTYITSFTFGNEVEIIPAYLCYGLTGLKSVTIGNSVSTIGNNAFGNCNGIKTMSWNAKLCSNMGSMPTSNIETVTIGNQVQTLPVFFVNGSKIKSVTIPNSVTSIGNYAFSGCSGLTSVNITDLSAWCKIGFGSGTSNPLCYAHHLFLNGNEIKDLVLPNSVTSIGNDAFYNCTGLVSVTIPNSVASIGGSAFEGCSGLTSIIIPNSVISIGNLAFNGCGGLKYVNCKPSTPPIISGSNAFSSSIPIFIPMGTMSTYKNANYWKNLNVRYTLTKITPYITHATIVSEDKEISHLVKVKINNREYSVSNDSILIDGLQPRNYNEYENNYSAIAYCKVLGEDRVDTIQFRTNPLNFVSMSGSSTQSTITPKFKVNRADEHGIKISITSSGAACGYPSKDYNGRIIEETDDYYVIETVPITGLAPNSNCCYTPWVTCNGKRCEGSSFYITTQNIGTSSNTTTGPTNVEMTGSYNAGDAHVKEAYFTFNGTKMKKISVTGLKPSTTYSTVYTVVTNNVSINTNMSFKTKDLTMTTQEARMLSDTSPMLIATTNIADVETSCGFEWRRYDAPTEMPSTKVYCPVYGGTMAGVLKNMSPNVYYKYRPFYKASDGSEYYGNWIAFITADAGVTFDPVVYTYKAPEVTQNSATLQGVALPGSSDITEQGFEYWRMGSSKAPTGTVNKVTATGQRMSATVQGLNAGATYGFRSYVIAGGQTYYGSEEQFTTEKATGDVNGDGKVNVSDVTALVNMILGLQPMDQSLGDVNGDGRVNVSDVTALINIILGIS